jgi:hypothetical protein
MRTGFTARGITAVVVKTRFRARDIVGNLKLLFHEMVRDFSTSLEMTEA